MVDHIVQRNWSLDLDEAGKVKPLVERPGKGPRQDIARFDGRSGTEEHFSYRLTLPLEEYDPELPPSRKQYDTVCDFYGEGPCSSLQAACLISAWYYAEEIRSVERFRFSAPRRRLIHLATSAFILSVPAVRRSVRAWSENGWRNPSAASIIERSRPYATVMQYAHDLIADMQGAGAEIFG